MTSSRTYWVHLWKVSWPGRFPWRNSSPGSTESTNETSFGDSKELRVKCSLTWSLTWQTTYRECEEELKAAIAIPANEDIASSRIKTFASYVNRIGQQFVETGGSNYGKPKVSSVPFFLSYFWQIRITPNGLFTTRIA